MMEKFLASPVPILAILCLLLLFDGTGLVRMGLLASLIHETGHCMIYMIQTKKLPKLSFGLCGIGLQADTLFQSRVRQTWLLLGGCIANFAVCILLLVLIECRATYGRYFFLAANFFVGCYNLLPVGILDGARLLSLWIPEKFTKLQHKLEFCTAVCMLLWVVAKLLAKKMPLQIGGGLILVFCALIRQSKHEIS